MEDSRSSNVRMALIYRSGHGADGHRVVATGAPSDKIMTRDAIAEPGSEMPLGILMSFPERVGGATTILHAIKTLGSDLIGTMVSTCPVGQEGDKLLRVGLVGLTPAKARLFADGFAAMLGADKSMELDVAAIPSIGEAGAILQAWDIERANPAGELPARAPSPRL